DFGGVGRVRDELRSLAEHDRKQTSRQWIQRTGVAGLAGAKQSLGSLQYLVGARPSGLVEQEHTVDGAGSPHRFVRTGGNQFPLPSPPGLPESSCTADSISFVSR